MNEYFHPVLTNQAAKDYEKAFFEKKGSDEWSMMQDVGARLGEQIYLDTHTRHTSYSAFHRVGCCRRPRRRCRVSSHDARALF